MDEYFNKDLYEILNIEKNASEEEIKFAYKKLAKIYHPDLNKTKDSREIFNDIRHAYDILSDKNKKNLYDIKHGFNKAAFENNIPTVPNPENENAGKKEDTSSKNKNFSEILSEIIEGIFVYSKKNVFDKKEKMKDKKNNDIYVNVTISTTEAVFGTSRIINIVQKKLCPNCEGKRFINEALCPLCKGLGEISNHKKINATIPPNTKNNDKVKIENAGNTSEDGLQAGDLYLIITVDEKSLFTLKGNDVYMDLPITPFEAALGAEIEIPTFYDNVKIKIPSNTSSGQKFRLKEQGIFDKKTNIKGYMIIVVYIKIPDKLSDKEIELYKSLRENNSCNIREGLTQNE